MGYQSALQGAKQFIAEQGGQIAPLGISEEEINPHEQEDLTQRAVHIEALSRTYPVAYSYPADSGQSEFRFFEDGRQRTIQIGHIPVKYGKHFLLLPVHYFVVGAVILRRDDSQKLELWNRPKIVQGVFVAKSLVPNQNVLSRYERDGYRIVDTDSGSIADNDYYALRTRALREAKKLRLKVEDDLIAEWRDSPDAADNFLVVDGTLMNLRDEKNVDRCVGVSKSFGARYFSPTDHHRIMRLKEFERSWTFRFHSDDESDDLRLGARERVSWYLRLRDGINREPEFGLIRVEISKRYIEESTRYADQFSKSLISERLPTSYPAPRWDKHLYPVRQCENYLSSIMPSGSTINASMKG